MTDLEPELNLAGGAREAVSDTALGDATRRLELALNRRLFEREGFVEVGRKSHPGYDRPTIAVMEKVL